MHKTKIASASSKSPASLSGSLASRREVPRIEELSDAKSSTTKTKAPKDTKVHMYQLPVFQDDIKLPIVALHLCLDVDDKGEFVKNRTVVYCNEKQVKNVCVVLDTFVAWRVTTLITEPQPEIDIHVAADSDLAFTEEDDMECSITIDIHVAADSDLAFTGADYMECSITVVKDIAECGVSVLDAYPIATRKQVQDVWCFLEKWVDCCVTTPITDHEADLAFTEEDDMEYSITVLTDIANPRVVKDIADPPEKQLYRSDWPMQNSSIPEERALARFINEERVQYWRNPDEYPEVKFNLLNEFPGFWEDTEHIKRWFERANKIKEWKAQASDPKIDPKRDSSNPNDRALAQWINEQRKRKNQNKLEAWQIEDLNAIDGWVWVANQKLDTWFNVPVPIHVLVPSRSSLSRPGPVSWS